MKYTINWYIAYFLVNPKVHFISIIAKDAVLVTDGHKSYDFIKKDKNIKHIVVKDEKGKGGREVHTISNILTAITID